MQKHLLDSIQKTNTIYMKKESTKINLLPKFQFYQQKRNPITVPDSVVPMLVEQWMLIYTILLEILKLNVYRQKKTLSVVNYFVLIDHFLRFIMLNRVKKSIQGKLQIIMIVVIRLFLSKMIEIDSYIGLMGIVARKDFVVKGFRLMSVRK